MSKKRDYYDVLGISKNATSDEIKKAYRTLAKKYHPDLSKEPKAEELFKEATEAAEILLDKNKRDAYDRYGHDGVNGADMFGAGGGFGDFFSNMGGSGDFFSDIFSNFFGGGMGSRKANNYSSRGEDLVIEMQLSIKELLTGVNKKPKVNILCKCETCNGLGAENPSDVKICEECNGNGVVNVIQNLGIAKFQTQKICKNCNGNGKTIKNPCKTCKGQKATKKFETLDIDIPKGLLPGQQIVLRNKGNFSLDGGDNGHIYINVFIKPGSNVKIINDFNLIAKLDVSYLDAILGSKIKIDTFDGPIDFDIPAGVENGKILKKSGHGLIKGVNSKQRGDLLVEVNIVVPKSLSKEEKAKIAELSNSSSFKVKNELN